MLWKGTMSAGLLLRQVKHFSWRRESVAVARPSAWWVAKESFATHHAERTARTAQTARTARTARTLTMGCYRFTELKKYKWHGQESNLIKGKRSPTILKSFFFNSFPFIANKANLLSITFFAETGSHDGLLAEIKTKQEKSIIAMKIDHSQWKSKLAIFLVIDFHRFPIFID